MRRRRGSRDMREDHSTPLEPNPHPTPRWLLPSALAWPGPGVKNQTLFISAAVMGVTPEGSSVTESLKEAVPTRGSQADQSKEKQTYLKLAQFK